jgi:hypothetical protein
MSQALNNMTVWEMKMIIVAALICGGFAVGLVFLGRWAWHLVASQP